MRSTAILFLFLIAGYSAPNVVAQAVEPFSEIEIIVSGATTRSVEPFSEYWTTGPGLAVRVETPFYLGHVFGSGMVSNVTARGDAEVPSFQSGLVTAGWAASIRLPGNIRVIPGAQTGLYWMRFDDPSANWASANEAEMAAGIDLRIAVPVGRGFYVTGSASAIRIFTHHPLDLQFFQIGVSRVFTVPGWLQEVFE